ncbi:MAG: hypothetical protein E7676_00515 [Ruminococcaceae bacterium]|nr:hypothetical protein [Oscillospiraceae bacterium]
MTNKLLRNKGSRSAVLSVMTVAIIVLTLALNFLITYIGMQKTLFVDTSFENLYTLSDMMKEECAFIDKLEGDDKVRITFCADPDTLTKSELTRVVYFMSLQLQKHFDKVEVVTENITYDPTSVSKYKATALKEILPNDVIISYGDRYRVVSTNAFWTKSGDILTSYFGEYKMASLIMSVTSINNPTAYFVADHGTTYYDAENPERKENIETAYLYNMLTERGLSTKLLNLSEVDEIPEDCVLLIINNPTEDFVSDPTQYDRFDYVSDTDKLDKYLVKNHGSIMVAKDYSLSLPEFEEFLYEWGFDLSTSLVKDESSHITNEDGSFTTLVAEYDTDEDSYGYAIYGEFASLKSSPSMVFDNTGYISCSYGDNLGIFEPGTTYVSRAYAPFFFTSSDARAYEKNEYGEYATPITAGRLDVASVVTRIERDGTTGEDKHSYIFCANSPDFFSNDHLGNASYANYEIMSALTENMIRSDEYANIDLGSTSMNSANRGGKVLLDTDILETDTYVNDILITRGLSSAATVWYVVLIMAIPVAVAVFGIVVRIKRKFL